MQLRLGHWAVIATVAVHGGLAAGLATIPREEPRSPTVITIREVANKPPPPQPPPPPPMPPPPAIAAQPAAPPKPAPPKRAVPPVPAPVASPAAAAAPADFGVKLSNAGGDGAALPAPREAAPQQPQPTAKTLTATPDPAEAGGCAEPIVKPKPANVVQPAFTQAAQDAAIVGKVRVEITISTTGAVIAARVIEGLGYGLDEAALDAAKASTFVPATRCGEPIETTFTIGMRFQR